MNMRQELKMQAKEAIRAQRTTAILIVLLVGLKVLALALLNGIVLRGLGRIPFILLVYAGVFALLMIAVSMMREFIKIYRGEPTRVEEFYHGLKNNWKRMLGGMLWMLLWVKIWSLIAAPVIPLGILFMRMAGRGAAHWILWLFVPVFLAALIPVFIKGLSYFMTPYILADCPEVRAREALALSKRMMDGHKKELFVLMLSFIGWMLLSALTLGILYIIYVGPYLYTTYAGFYDKVRERALTEGKIVPEELGTAIVVDDVEIEVITAPEVDVVVEIEEEAEVEPDLEEEVEIEPEAEIEVEVIEDMEDETE